MMRKWRVGLYRYGLRLTYDIAIPEPGATLRDAYKELDELQQLAAQNFEFPLKHSDIDETSYLGHADHYGAQVPPPPTVTLIQILGGPVPGLTNNDDDTNWHFNQLTFTVAEGYEISNVTVEVFLSNVDNARQFYVFGSGQAEDLPPHAPNKTVDLTVYNQFMLGRRGNQTITYFVQNAGVGAVTFTVRQTLTNEARGQWVTQVWNALYNAAQAYFLAT